jgi:hypothetical protein
MTANLNATAWRILRALLVDVLCSCEGGDPDTKTEADKNALLERWFARMGLALDQLHEILLQAHAMGSSEALERFHRTAVREYAGHDLLDEALEYTAQTPDGYSSPLGAEAPLMDIPRRG